MISISALAPFAIISSLLLVILVLSADIYYRHKKANRDSVPDLNGEELYKKADSPPLYFIHGPAVLFGKPESVIKSKNRYFVVESKKGPGPRVLPPWYENLFGFYFILIEKTMDIHDAHGVVKFEDGKVMHIKNTHMLRRRVLHAVDEIVTCRQHAAYNNLSRNHTSSTRCRQCRARGICDSVIE